MRRESNFQNGNPSKSIVGSVLPQAAGNAGVGLKRKHFASFPHQACRREREKSHVGSRIVKDHSRPQVLHQDLLGFWLNYPFANLSSRSGIYFYPKTLGRAGFDFMPDLEI